MANEFIKKTPRLSKFGLYNLQKSDIERGDLLSSTRSTLYNYNYENYYDAPGYLSNTYNIDSTGAIESDPLHIPSLTEEFENNQFDKYSYLSMSDSWKLGNLSNDASQTVQENQWVKEEKDRIKAQKESHDYGRDDHFSIGTVYLRIPPTQINITNEAHNYRYNALRSPGEVVMTSGRSTSRIDLDIIFSSVEEINKQLRPLLAQFKTTPFLPIENEYLKNILNPFNQKLVDANLLSGLKKQREEMGTVNESVNKLLKYSAEKSQKENEIGEIVKDFRDKGYITDQFYTDLMVGGLGSGELRDPEKISKSKLTEEDYKTDIYGNKKVDLEKYIKRNITVQGPEDINFIDLSRNLNQIDEIDNRISEIDRKSSELMVGTSEERFLDRQLVGVLSQLMISTIPDLPESLACRISMYVFNYDPFTIDFAFIYGYDRNSATPDITKCDLFIDWYTKRFLADRADPNKPSLGRYIPDNSISFTYAKNIRPVTYETKGENVADIEKLSTGDGLIPTGISVSLKNIIQFLPILSSKNPTCQYMGSINSDIQFTFQCVNPVKTNQLSKMVDKIGRSSRVNNRISRVNFISVKNSLLELLGMPYFMIDNYTIDTVPGSPGMDSIVLNLIEYKPGQEKFQKLIREKVLTNEDVIDAAKYVLEKANQFATRSSDPNSQSLYYKTLYDKVCHPEYGWFNKNNNFISAFVNGVGGSSESNMEIRDKILFNSPEISWYEGFAGQGRRVVNNLAPLVTKNIVEGNIDSLTGKLSGDTFSWDVAKRYRRSAKDSEGKPDNLRSGALFKRDYYAFEGLYKKSLINDSEDKSFWKSNLDTVAKVVAVMRRSDLVGMIFNVKDNPELNERLNLNREKSKRTADLDAAKVYCYPDLELPRYKDIPYGYKYRNTLKEAGIPHKKGEENKTTQSENSEVDPDFFFYKGSLWKNIDNSNNTFNGVERGIEVFKGLIESNKYRRTEAPDEDVLAAELANKQKQTLNDKYNIQGTEAPESLIKELEGKPVKVTEVYDGDTLTVLLNDEEISIRLLGYDAPELKDSENKKANDIEHAKAAQKELSNLTLGKDVQLYSILRDPVYPGRYLANIVTEKNGNTINVNEVMISKSKELNLSYFSNPDNPRDPEAEEIFYRSQEIYVKSILDKEKSKYEILTQSLPLFGKGVAAGMLPTSMAIDTGKTIAGMLTSDKNKAETTNRENLALLLGSHQARESGIKKGSLNPFGIFPESKLTNDSNAIVAKTLMERTDNTGGKRFDREEEYHVSLIAQKIRESQKDITLRMVRAFPTFKIYFIEEDMPEWGRLDDLYSYQAVNSIDVTKSRTDPADVAVINFFNTRGTLDRSLFGLWSKDGKLFVPRGVEESFEPSKQETRAEQDLQEFILKPGTLIKIKMGYGSDPDLLDTVFTGMVAEVSGGDMIQVVAQGFGVELLHQVPASHYFTENASAFKVLDRLIKNPEVLHFGRVTWIPEELSTNKKLFRRAIEDPKNPGKFIYASRWRNIAGIRSILAIREDARDNNIWVPENSFLYNVAHGGWQSFVTGNKTIWDVFRDMMRRMPGYITTVLPFDNRATIYFGPADFLYHYTAENTQARKTWEINYYDDMRKSDDEKLKKLQDDYGFQKMDNLQMNQEVSGAAKYIEKLVNGEYSGNSGVLDRVNDLRDSVNNDPITGEIMTPETYRKLRSASEKKNISDKKKNSKAFIDTSVMSTLTTSEGDMKNKKRFEYISRMLGSGGKSKIRFDVRDSSGKKIVDMRYDGGEECYVSPTGDILTKPEAIEKYNEKRRADHQVSDPTRKLVRQYHFKDSFHHIISNSIVATSNYLYNKVTVEYGNEIGWSAKKMWEGAPTTSRVSAQIDDDIWPEKVKEKMVQERNARDIITAWHYALGNLWEEARKMYSGHLVVLGDASIKPYDFVMVSDYFTDMYGPIEVEQVTHHFSSETGFVTTIVPNLVCYVNNALQRGSMVIAGSYMDEVSKQIQRIRGAVAGGGLFLAPGVFMGNITANIAFWFTGLSTARREPLSFTPLMYAGRPFIAGVEGMKRTSIIEAVNGHLTRFSLQAKRVADMLTNGADTLGIYVQERLGNLR